jgi:hypothetical protein
MADKDDDLVVNVDDLDTIAVNVDDDPKLAGEPEHIKKEAKTKEKVSKPRVDPNDQQAVVKSGPTPEEALAQAQAYAKTQEDARRAAEATAASERAQREQAQREAAQAREHADQQRERADNSELTVIENGIASATREVEAYEAEYTRAAEAGEFAKMASIQTKMSKASARLDRLESEKASYEAGARKTTTHEGRVEAQPQIQSNPVEQYLAQMAPAAQNWMRQHLDCIPANLGGDAVKNSKMMAGHYAALAASIREGSPEYFKTIEDHISPPTQQQVVDPKVASKAAEVQTAGEVKKPAPSAPVTRDAPNAAGQPQRNVREVRLTKDQQEMAKVSFPHLPEAQAFGQYARNLIELEAEGKIGRLTH